MNAFTDFHKWIQKINDLIIKSFHQTLNFISISLTKFFLRTFGKKVLAGCGHSTYLKDVVTFNGTPRIIKILNKSVPYCHKCLEKMTIQCTWCGNPIFIGSRITLHSPGNKFIIPHYAIKNEDFPGGYVGCDRVSCCDMLGELIGFWTTPGKIELTEEYKKTL